MSTNGMESWAVDQKDVGANYPFQGTEDILVILGLACWIGFHELQARVEAEEQADAERHFNAEHSNKRNDRY